MAALLSLLVGWFALGGLFIYSAARRTPAWFRDAVEEIRSLPEVEV